MMLDGNDCLTLSYFMVVAFKIPLSTYCSPVGHPNFCSIEILRKAILRETEFLLHFDNSSCKFSVYCRR